MSPSRNPNTALVDLSKKFARKDNAEFFAEVRQRIDALDLPPLPREDTTESALEEKRKKRSFRLGGRAAIGLIGEYGMIGYGVRRAQELLRFDRTPSYWSHAFLFYDEIPADAKAIRSPSKSPVIWESSVDLVGGPIPQARMVNGVGPRPLADYAYARYNVLKHHCVPNVAVVVFALSEEEIQQILDRASSPNTDRLRYDFLGVLGTWLAYLLNRASMPNPLSQGDAVYCSAYVQMAYEAIGLDLSIGAHQRNTAPEHIWQAAKWYHDVFSQVGFPVAGYWCVRDPTAQLLPAGKESVADLAKATSLLRPG